ncbi:hypothetical protein ACFLZT_06200, partial [Thermodesulfobacteriota bacterium]
MIGGVSCSDYTVTIVGTVNKVAQIEVEDDIYDIEKNEIGDKVAGLVHREISVSGTIHEEDGKKIISIKSYEVLEE